MIEESLGYLLNTSARLIKRDLDLQLANYNLTSSQWAVLKLVQENNLSQAEIADRSLSDRATIGSIIDKLIVKNLICKKLSENDRRSYRVSITEKGRDIMAELKFFGQESNKKAVNNLTDEEIKTLTKCLKIIIKNF